MDLLEGPGWFQHVTLFCWRTCWGYCRASLVAGRVADRLPFILTHSGPARAADTDLLEMRHEVEAALESASGVGGWLMELVGGSRRQQRPEGEQERTDRPHHDAGGWLSFFSYIML